MANSSRVYRCLSPKQAADLRICRLLVLASVGTLRTSCGLITDQLRTSESTVDKVASRDVVCDRSADVRGVVI